MKKDIVTIGLIVMLGFFCFVFIVALSVQGSQLRASRDQVDQLTATVSEQDETITQQEATIAQLESGRVTYKLNSCPICGGDAIMKQVYDDNFYIRCESCSLHTDYFDSRSELAKYWNGEE